MRRRRSALLSAVCAAAVLALTPAVSTASAGSGESGGHGRDDRDRSGPVGWQLSSTGTTAPQRGVAMSDPVGGRFRLVETADGGHSWSVVDPAGMPPAKAGEFGFAGSGTCLTAGQGSSMYLASGGVDPGRVFTSADRGHPWKVADTPIVPRRLPVRFRLGAVPPERGARGRPQRLGCLVGLRALLARLRRRQLRQRGMHRRRVVLGVG